jgi:hypothetical protein
MNTQLSLLGESGLELGGIRLCNSALSVPADATDADLEAIGRFLKFSARGSQWHWGDYILAVAARKGDLWDAASLATAWGQDEEKIREAVASAKFYPAESRREALSFSHHVEAMGTGSHAEAIAALALAEEKGWTKIELRAHLRKSAAEITAERELGGSLDDERDEPGPVRELWVSDLCALDRVAKSKLSAGWVPDIEAATALLKKTQHLRELLQAIEEAAGIEV